MPRFKNGELARPVIGRCVRGCERICRAPGDGGRAACFIGSTAPNCETWLNAPYAPVWQVAEAPRAAHRRPVHQPPAAWPASWAASGQSANHPMRRQGKADFGIGMGPAALAGGQRALLAYAHRPPSYTHTCTRWPAHADTQSCTRSMHARTLTLSMHPPHVLLQRELEEAVQFACAVRRLVIGLVPGAGAHLAAVPAH